MDRVVRPLALKVPLSAEELAAPKEAVCVTGASGYIASFVVQRLLAAGHTVHAAVRSRAKAAFLTRLPGAAERLRIFDGCDLLAPGSFDSAMAGCAVVMHTASPFALGVRADRVKETLLDPAVGGTRNVLESVNRMPSVRRVVLTSSITAVLSYPLPGKVYTEDDWNDQSSEKEYAYELSKTLAEREAWAIAAAQDRWDMVALLPGLVFGPPMDFGHSNAQSVHVMRRMLRGDMSVGYPEYFLKSVDVRDVAKAHAMAMITPNAHGRYLLTPHGFTFGHVKRVIRAGPLGADAGIRRRLPSKPLFIWLLWLIADMINIERYRLYPMYGVELRADGSRCARELGMTSWVPDAEMYNEMAATMIVMGMCKWMDPRACAPLCTDSMAPAAYEGPWPGSCWDAVCCIVADASQRAILGSYEVHNEVRPPAGSPAANGGSADGGVSIRSGADGSGGGGGGVAEQAVKRARALN